MKDSENCLATLDQCPNCDFSQINGDFLICSAKRDCSLSVYEYRGQCLLFDKYIE